MVSISCAFEVPAGTLKVHITVCMVRLRFSRRHSSTEQPMKNARSKPIAYPRDLVGYGKRLPDPKWPDGARLALQISLNYEAGGERSVLHGDGVSESVLTDIGSREVKGARHVLT